MDDPIRAAGGKLGEYGYTRASSAGERSTADVLKDIVGNVQEIVRSEVRLAKVELREESGKLANAGKMLGAAGLIGLYAGFFILLAVVYGLSSVMSAWMAAGIVGVGLAIIAAILFSVGKGRLSLVHKPETTVDTVKENIEWMKGQNK